MKNVVNKIQNWKDKLLSYGGRVVLISHGLQDALFYKLWWNLRSKPSLWGSFMANKYYNKLHPVIAKCRGASTI
ncbi:hypothetical protein H5410_040848 [Solanum commersonii]|uniref:Uncharacterized protein n=1 Tax=Solanum commersonii TaxID=4109 RepID=A0A9J5XTS3_SOLCO|nr:hypothetical protein H5410_040848 [Solanum commersonii]